MWLAGARDRTAFLIAATGEDAGKQTTTAAKKAATNKFATKKVTAKKVATKNISTKRAVQKEPEGLFTFRRNG
jgi:hypothetical protein